MRDVARPSSAPYQRLLMVNDGDLTPSPLFFGSFSYSQSVKDIFLVQDVPIFFPINVVGVREISAQPTIGPINVTE